MLKLAVKKNIILFSIDYRRKDLYATFGGNFPSPNMERLAEQGVKFDRMYAPAGSTIMSLSALINGRYCHEFPRYSYSNDSFFDDNLFAKMKASGRRTFMMYSSYLMDTYGKGIYQGPDAEIVKVPDFCRSPEAAKHLIALVEKTEESYFIMFHNVAPEKQVYDADTPCPLEEYVRDDDEAVGMLLDAIDLSDTTIVFYSDHGFMNGEHGLFSHAFFLYEPIVRVPCIITSDEANTTSEPYSLKQLYDLLVHGEMKVEDYLFGDTQYKVQPHRITMCVKDRWKYMAHYSPHSAITGRQEELYDLVADPHENRNLLYDVGRHPFQSFHNSDNIRETSFDAFRYADEYIQGIANELREQVSDIWCADLLDSVTNYLKRDTHDNIAQELSRLSAYEKLAYVSNYMNTLDRPPLWYGPAKKPELEPIPQPPFGYSNLPTSFKEFA